MKKKRLIITDPLAHATLLGIASAFKAYKLAWLINRTTTLQLAKVVDSCSEAIGQAGRCTTHFLFETEHCTCRLIKNRDITGQDETARYLVPSLKHIDFFFSVRDMTQTFDVHAFCGALEATKEITYITNLNLVES